MNYTPVIIIGSGRSGTNMLRDIITAMPDFDTWDCDEINPVWRYGNKKAETDELSPSLASNKIKSYIRKRFNQRHKKNKAKYIVEKTCANSLRLDYVYEVFPDAKYIIINRDGRDVVPSAMKRWNSSFDLKYTLKKLRYVPLTDLFFYVWKFGSNRLKKTFLKKESLSFWGPVYKGIHSDTANLPLMELCAQQWVHCAENTLKHREQIPAEKIFDVRYETFVNNPKQKMTELLSFLKVEKDIDVDNLVKKVSTRSVGLYKKEFTEEEQIKLNQILKPTLLKLNYSNVD
ncbi:sulfotransferase family protein [Olleya namhaensis]|uniref:sulfotransferase family protein n=1 Tax=Olleya namhaensis TaxID=1144750 RepID=UPI0024910905|nr:sulfotransferase [Olleya namhaensis]